MNSSYAQILGKRLRYERDKLGYSQLEFAAACEVGVSAQRGYELGQRVPDANYLFKLRTLGADVLFVLFGDDGERDSKGYSHGESAHIQPHTSEAELQDNFMAMSARDHQRQTLKYDASLHAKAYRIVERVRSKLMYDSEEFLANLANTIYMMLYLGTHETDQDFIDYFTHIGLMEEDRDATKNQE